MCVIFIIVIIHNIILIAIFLLSKVLTASLILIKLRFFFFTTPPIIEILKFIYFQIIISAGFLNFFLTIIISLNFSINLYLIN